MKNNPGGQGPKKEITGNSEGGSHGKKRRPSPKPIIHLLLWELRPRDKEVSINGVQNGEKERALPSRNKGGKCKTGGGPENGETQNGKGMEHQRGKQKKKNTNDRMKPVRPGDHQKRKKRANKTGETSTQKGP